ncbi:MAG: YihY/virulence factor BrkB family protein, partial [Actinomycetota bacterium]|nr:YihY/virulence factor BrkB family protein [Actinomycetota bacterium]
MNAVKRLLRAIDRWQQHNRVVGPAYAVVKKFGDDQANLLVVALGWYGFTAIYPLLLVVVTVFGYIGEASLGTGIVNTLRAFPVIGTQFKAGPGGSHLHGTAFGLVVGLGGLMYGAQGVTQTAQQAMASVWNVPQYKMPGFLQRLGRSILGLAIIGGAFLSNALVGGIAASSGQSIFLRVPLIAGMVIANVGFYYSAFWVLTPKAVPDRRFLPGAILAGLGFTVLTTLGTGLVQHQLRHASDTYGAFASVIGVVTYLLLLAKLTVYAAELNPVLARRLWPRALPTAPPTAADDQVLRDRAHQEQRREDERIGVA